MTHPVVNVIESKVEKAGNQVWGWFEKLVTVLGGRTIAMLVGTLLITIVSIVSTDNWILSMGGQDVLVGKTRITISELNQLQTNMYKAESAQRGYLYTNGQDYVEPFNKALMDARNNVKKIDALIISTTAGNEQKEQLELLKAITASLESKAAEMKITLDLVASGKMIEAKQVLALGAGTSEMKKFIDYSNKMIKNSYGTLKMREKERLQTMLLTRVSLICGAVLIIVLMTLVIKQLLAEIATKTHLQQQVIHENEIYEQKLEQQTKLLRSLALDYQADVERERHKLSRELHDELGSILTATKMDVSWVMKKLKEVSPVDVGTELIEKLKKTNRYIDQGINFKRQVVQELHPAMISTFGFWPALKSLIEDAVDRNHWQLTLSLPDESTQLNETISLVAYRIIQESLNNANKYAKATSMFIHIMVDEKFLKVEIEDNGIGIDIKSLNNNTHGLSGMRHRVLAIGGYFELLSEPGKGLLTRALIPLDI
ncbi:MAG TPA: CHASE3 domain-containing protein [Methylotenera sp.]|nr:CHASE3 domain-containing protein [Methylotenera sp.]